MYPRISDMIFDLTGLKICLPVFTYGFFLACAFLVAAYIIFNELKRMESEGLLHGMRESHVIGQGVSVADVAVNALLGFLLGYKGAYLAQNWCAFSNDPSNYLLTSEGVPWAGILGAVMLAGYRYYESSKDKLPQPETVEETVFPHQRVGDLVMLAAIFGILGSKLFTWFEDWEGFMRDPMGALTSFSGLTFYGGLICASIAILIYVKRKNIPINRLLDAVAPALILAYGIGRLGCHFSGDGDWGIVNTMADKFSFLPDWLWAYTYPGNVAHVGVPMPDCVGEYCKVLPEPVYPTSVYEFFFSVTIFGILWALRKRLKVAGMLFGVYLLLNGIERFLIETIRVNDRYEVLGFYPSQAQIIAVCLFLAGVAWVLFLKSQGKSEVGAS